MNLSTKIGISLLSISIFFQFMALGQVFAPAKLSISSRLDEPVMILPADMDNDGDLDLLGNFDERIAWYENRNNGEFYIYREIEVNPNQERVWPVDLDDDGLLDILSSKITTIGWYKNLGEGTFAGEQLIPGSYQNARFLEAGDISGDGLPDIIISDFDAKTYSWVKNLGGGNFGPEQLINNSSYDPKWVHCVDLDNDGHKDLLTRERDAPDERMVWFKNSGSGTFGGEMIIETALKGTGNISLVDVELDGDLDIVSTSGQDDKLTWNENLGSGNFGPQQIISTDQDGVKHASVGDIDGDGYKDIIAVSDKDEKVVSYLNNGSGFTELETISIEENLWIDNAIADMDNDGDLDVICMTRSPNQVLAFNNLGTGSFDDGFLVSEQLFGSISLTGDMDMDGDFDLAFISGRDIFWVENTDDEFLRRHQIVSMENNGQAFALNDFDEDGDLDVVYHNASSVAQLEWSENDGSGNFISISTVSPSIRYHEIFFSDFDGDGDEDMVAYDRSRSEVVYYQKTAPATLNSPVLITDALTDIGTVVAGDLDNDGDLDLVASGRQDNRIFSIGNDGAGNFSFKQKITTSAFDVSDIELGDVNGDGQIDLIAAELQQNKLLYFENLGAGILGPKIVLDSGLGGLRRVLLRDFDLDGDLDLVTNATEVGKLFLFENLNGTLLPRKKISDAQIGSMLFAVDSDGDGDLDVYNSIADFFGGLNLFENLSISNCSVYKAPTNPASAVTTDSILLSWDASLQSIGCQINARRISPFSQTTNSYFYGADLSGISIPIVSAVEGSSWVWRVRCACDTGAFAMISKFSTEDTFFVSNSLERSGNLASDSDLSYELFYGPNPASDFLQIEISQGSPPNEYSIDVDIKLTNINGEIVHQQQLKRSTFVYHRIPIAKLPDGSYILTVTINEESISRLVLKE